MTKTEAERLAAAAHAMRPDWPTTSVLSFLSKPEMCDRAYRDVAVALAWVAAEPTTLTPARVLEAGPWWKATTVAAGTVSAITILCPEHPTERAWDCQPCRDAAVPPADVPDLVEALLTSLAQAKATARSRQADMNIYLGDKP